MMFVPRANTGNPLKTTSEEKLSLREKKAGTGPPMHCMCLVCVYWGLGLGRSEKPSKTTCLWREAVPEKKSSSHALHVSGLGVLGILGGCAQLGDTYCYFLAQRYIQTNIYRQIKWYYHASKTDTTQIGFQGIIKEIEKICYKLNLKFQENVNWIRIGLSRKRTHTLKFN